MQCDICFRTGGNKLPFLCPTDARNRLYDPRVQHAGVLLENDTLQHEIEALLPQPSKEGVASRPVVDDILAEREQVLNRTEQIIAHADELRKKVVEAREEIAKRRAANNEKKAALTAALDGIESKRTKQIEETEKSLRILRYKWNQAYAVTASSRAYLCGEAAKLYGLQRHRKNGELETYTIAGVTVPDLRFMNTTSAAHISTGLSHVVHLVMLSTHYLAIRLPAEITLPHRDYPLPTILPLASSYKHTNIPFPAVVNEKSSGNSPTVSRYSETQGNQPHPRPLFIDKPLPMLSNDPATFGLFVEGVALLAYNIAWLCKSQGIPVGEQTSFEDICNIGKNLYNLLVGSKARSPPTQASTRRSSRSNDRDVDEKKPIIGHFSHGTAHSFLGSAEGSEFVRSWKLPNPLKITDKLRNRLLGEVGSAEWEVLNEDAWAVEDRMGDDGVVVGARREGGLGRGRIGRGTVMQSFMSMRTVMDAVEMVGNGREEKPAVPGTNGWTKLKPRDKGD